MDALAMLTSQHRQIEALLARAREGDRGAMDELADAVSVHLAVEQDLLYPQIGTRISHTVLAELHAEHAEIRRVLAELYWHDADGDARDRDPLLCALAHLLEGHAAWQDRELFESLAETLPDAALADLAATLQAGFDSIHALAA
jgi:hemerythrin